MTQKELIRQEIERRKEELERDKYINIDAKACRHSELKFLERFIDSLPEEKPSEDLEEAANEYAGVNYDCETETDAFYHHVQKEAFKAGTEWQYQKDRGEFAKLKAKEWCNGYDEGIAKGKEQIMKDAVEGEIGYWNQSGLSIRLDKSLEKLGYDEDTEVKIIIVKQDDRPRD